MYSAFLKGSSKVKKIKVNELSLCSHECIIRYKYNSTKNSKADVLDEISIMDVDKSHVI